MELQKKKVKAMYIGVNGFAKEIKRAHIGVSGKARLFFFIISI